MLDAEKFHILYATKSKELSGPLPSVALSALRPPKRSSNSSNSSDADFPPVGGVLKNGIYSWLARGSKLVVLRSKTNCTISSYDFNQTFKELRFTVNACCGCESLILVGLKSQDGRGCVTVYEPRIAKVLKAIDVPYPVTALEVIATRGGAVASTRCLYKSLRWFFGIAAVGTEEGHLYLLDLRFDGKDGLELIPSRSEILPPTLRNVPKLRENLVAENSYISFELQASCHEDGVFHYILPDDEILESYYPCDASVTTILYEPRVASLFVGFNFGQFQIVSLQDMSLIFSSDFEGNNTQVRSFSFQEPENDPRKYCYLWVTKGQKQSSNALNKEDEPLTLSMFQLCYSKKELLTHPRHEQEQNSQIRPSGVLYNNFETCCMRFTHSLGPGIISTLPQCYGSILHMCMSVEKYASDSEALELPDEEDYCLSPSTSFCIFGWQTRKDKRKNQPELNVIVFDINRWYMAQMPQRFRGDEDDYLFAAFWTFDDFPLGEDEVILGMHVPKDKISHFSSGKHPLPERYFLPSACSFSLNFITNEAVNHYSLSGHQQQVLDMAADHMSTCLVNPEEMHGHILASELYSKHIRNQAFTPDMMRENILTAALQHGQISFLLSVVKDLASGHLAACGCTLRFMMDWAWKSVAHVKSSIDGLCVPIFDCSSPALDRLMKSQLQFNTTQIQNLRIVFHKLMEYTEDASTQSQEELNTKLNVVTLIHQYLEAVQWFITNGLLPEQFDNIDNDDEIITPGGIFIYKYSRIRQVFDQRRSELKRLNTPDLLLIDGWVEKIGEPLTSRWTKEENGKPSYPPPSFMSLLDMYYIDCVDVVTKHCLVMYLLYDVIAMFSTLDNADDDPASELRRERSNSMAVFLEVFSVPAGLIKLIQAFWLLDHQNFQEALSIFLDADTSRPYAAWQERRILRAFFYQEHSTMALKYISARHPRVETVDDAKMHIAIYVKSREPLKAWNLLQISVGQHDMNELFSHLFTSCQKHSQLDLLLKLPLTGIEEDMVIKYLKESNSPDSTQILVLFYLQKSKYVEAIRLHSQSKHTKLMRDQSEESRRRNAKLDHIVQAYSNLLPKIERDINLSSQRFFKQHVRREVYKPPSHPSVLRHAMDTEPSSHAERLMSRMNESDKRKRNEQEPIVTPLRRKPFEPKLPEGDIFIYPKIDQSKRRSSIDIQRNMDRRSSFGSPLRTTFSRDPRMSASNSVLRIQDPRDRRLSSLSVASMLLQTPPIVKQRPLSNEPDPMPIIQTPQSILKVKKIGLRKDRDQTSSISGIIQPSSGVNERLFRLENQNDVVESENESSDSEGDIKNEIPTISTPSAKILNQSGGLRRFKMRTEFAMESTTPKTTLETPKRLRFAGLDSSANDSGLSAILTPTERESHEQEIPKAEDSGEMEVDVTGMSDEQIMEKLEIPTPAHGEDIEYVNISEIPVEDDKYIEPIQLSDVEEDDEVIDSSNERLGEDAASEQEQEEQQPVALDLPEQEENDEVICLDSSSENSKEHVPEEKQENLGQEEVKEPNESLRLVLTSSEEGSFGTQEEEGSIGTQEEEEYGSEAFSLEQEDSRDVPYPVESGILTEDAENPSEREHPDEEVVELISDDDEFEDDVVTEENPDQEEDSEEEGPAEKPEIVEKDVFLGQLDEDVLEVLDEDSGSGNENSPLDENPQDISVELFVPHLVSQEEMENLISCEEVQTQDLKVVEGVESSQTQEKNLGLDLGSDEGSVPGKQNQGEESSRDEADVENLKLESCTEKEVISETSETVLHLQDEDVPDPIRESHKDEEPESVKEEKFIASSFQYEEEKLELAMESHMEEDVPVKQILENLEMESPIEEDQALRLQISTDEDEESSAVEDNEIPKNLKREEDPGPTTLEEATSDYQSMSGTKIEEETPEQIEVGDVISEEKNLVKNLEMMEEEQAEDSKMMESAAQSIEKSKTESPSKAKDVIPTIEIVLNPATPVVERVRTESQYVLSPPLTRKSKRKTTQGTQYTPKPAVSEVQSLSSTHTKTTQVTPAPDPNFLFSPPKTRTRSSRRKNVSTPSTKQTTLSPPKSTTKRTRGKTRSSDRDSDHSSVSTSPVRRSARKKQSETTQVTSEKSPAKVPSTPPPSDAELPSTPSRRTRQSPARTRQSPARKAPSTPTRSSSRIKAKLSSASESDFPPDPLPLETPQETLSVPKRTRRRKTSASSDVASTETESDAPSTPSRRSTRKSVSKSKSKSSPSQQETLKIPQLTPLPEEKEEDTSNKKRKKEKESATSQTTRATRSSTTYATRMRRKAKIFTLDK